MNGIEGAVRSTITGQTMPKYDIEWLYNTTMRLIDKTVDIRTKLENRADQAFGCLSERTADGLVKVMNQVEEPEPLSRLFEKLERNIDRIHEQSIRF
jgi:hypothetical protein